MRQLIIARKDLQMSPGKLAAQCCHASLACPGYSVKEISTQQFPLAKAVSIIFGIFLFEPTPEIGFIMACILIVCPSILAVTYFERTKIMLL